MSDHDFLHNPTNTLVQQLHAELKTLAAARLRGDRAGQGLSATSLVHAAYLKLVSRDSPWQSRADFFAAAANAMRQLLVDASRRRAVRTELAADPGLRLDASLLESVDLDSLKVSDMLAIDEALAEQARLFPDHHRVVMLRFFAGLTETQIAEVLGVDERTVRRRWKAARLWLFDRIHGNS